EVLKHLLPIEGKLSASPTDQKHGVEIIGIVVNERGAERAIATGMVSTLGFPHSISETFLRKNQNQSPEENWNVLKAIKRDADAAKIDRSEEHTSELQSLRHLVCRLLLEKKKELSKKLR